jgi:hypothetical protein
MIIQKASHIVGRGLVGQFRVLAFGPAWLWPSVTSLQSSWALTVLKKRPSLLLRGTVSFDGTVHRKKLVKGTECPALEPGLRKPLVGRRSDTELK